MINQKVFGMLLMAGVLTSVLVALNWSQNANASVMSEDSADVDVAEAAQAENVTVTNQTTISNMTGTNSTN